MVRFERVQVELLETQCAERLLLLSFGWRLTYPRK